jgi:hypothetical protein
MNYEEWMKYAIETGERLAGQCPTSELELYATAKDLNEADHSFRIELKVYRVTPGKRRRLLEHKVETVTL